MSKTITTSTQESDSIELSRNAKGQVTWTIKLYGDSKDSDLVAGVQEIDGRLRVKFPITSEDK